MSVNLNNLEPRLNKAAFQILTQWWIDKKIDSQELKVIGRWALDYPKTMEALDASELHTLALPQAEMELEILQSKEAKDKLAQGLTEMEIMREAEIDLEFYLIKAPKLSNPKFHQALEKDLYLAEETEKYKVFKEILEQHKISNFKGSYYTHDLQQGSRAAKSFSILKDDNSEANKNTQELIKKAFEANVSLIAKEYEKEFDIFEYRGLVISGEKTSLNSLSFYVSTPDKKIFIEPHNMVYKRKDNQQLFSLESLVTFGGFVTRLNNFCNDIDKFIESNNENIRRLNKEIKELEAITGENAIEYRRKDYLEALREDNRLIIDEIEKSAKDKNYKSEFEPKSAKILQALNAKSFKNEEILR